jgi:hypothetical protein
MLHLKQPRTNRKVLLAISIVIDGSESTGNLRGCLERYLMLITIFFQQSLTFPGLMAEHTRDK